MQIERRKFPRHILQFRIDIRGDSQDGKPFFEKTQLINISGGGALFKPLRLDQYYKGQVVEVNIMLPGTPDIKGQMKTKATVVRLDQDSCGQMQIIIHFMDTFKLFRIEEPQNNINDQSTKTYPK